MFNVFLAVMTGGALGSAGRLAVSLWMLEKFGDDFPWGTLAVNVTGSFLIGVIYTITAPEGPLSGLPLTREFVVLGVLGGYTTFSTFSLQTLHLLQAGQWALALFNALVSVTACLLAVWAGVGLASLWTQ